MDIGDYFVSPNTDGKEWIKHKVMGLKWELRRSIEEVEYLAEKYQMKKKYDAPEEELSKIYSELRGALEKSRELAFEIRNFS